MNTICCIALFIATLKLRLCYAAEDSGDLARGWNANIKWVRLDEATKLSKTNNKPIMLLIHKSWCGACKALMPQFAESKDIDQLSSKFVMVNVLDDEEPSDVKYAPDGGYIPRVLFIDQRGTVLNDIYNINGSDNYKYYYHDPQDIAMSMRQCLEKTKDITVTTDEL